MSYTLATGIFTSIFAFAVFVLVRFVILHDGMTDANNTNNP